MSLGHRYSQRFRDSILVVFAILAGTTPLAGIDVGGASDPGRCDDRARVLAVLLVAAIDASAAAARSASLCALGLGGDLRLRPRAASLAGRETVREAARSPHRSVDRNSQHGSTLSPRKPSLLARGRSKRARKEGRRLRDYSRAHRSKSTNYVIDPLQPMTRCTETFDFSCANQLTESCGSRWSAVKCTTNQCRLDARPRLGVGTNGTARPPRMPPPV